MPQDERSQHSIDEDSLVSSGAESATRIRVKEALRNDPRIYHSIDYWGVRNGTGGHGIKQRTGQQPPNAVQEKLERWPWGEILNKAARFSKPSWHFGEGVVGEFRTPETVNFIFFFQRSSSGTFNSRPDVFLYTVVPATPEFEDTVMALEIDPYLLLDIFPDIAPEEARTYANGIQLVNQIPLDVTPYLRK